MNEVFHVLLQPHEIQERAPFRQCDQQIQIAFLVPFTSGQGAEQANVLCSVALRQIEDFRSV
jgi:hypothetical protein